MSIENVNFFENENQISAYKKNLQYGTGGEASIINSLFKSKTNNFLSENSKIKIKDSKIDGLLKQKGSEIFINDRK